MYFPDLSVYSYSIGRTLENVLNVGWLDEEHVYSVGTVDSEFVRRVVFLAIARSVKQMRGFHDCAICGAERPVVRAQGEVRRLGSAEIWVPREGGYFASPDMLAHYVIAHDYRPPQSYISAVLALDLDSFRLDGESIPPEAGVGPHGIATPRRSPL